MRHDLAGGGIVAGDQVLGTGDEVLKGLLLGHAARGQEPAPALVRPTANVGDGVEKATVLISDMLNYAMDQEELPKYVLLETMAGKGTEVGRTFEELASIIDRTERKDRLGVCLDTCHVYDGGYDIVNDLDGVLRHFDEVIGLSRLHAIHLNDDKNPLGSHKDRHEKIGEGTLGLDAIARIINHPLLRDLPFYLETPNELPGYKKEIALLKGLREP